MEMILTFFCGAGGAAVINMISKVIQRYADRRDKNKDTQLAKDQQKDQSTANDIAELKEIMSRLIVADRMILYDRIKHLAKAYIKRCYVTVEELEDLRKMHEVYHNELNGNGFLDDLMQAVMALPVRAF